MFGRKKQVQEPERQVVPDRPGAKNRPTPKRREVEAARKRPLVVTDRKAAAKADRSKVREERLKQREALVTGDEAHLPLRDKGPQRRFVRDVVDARWNLGEWYLVLALVAVVLVLIPPMLGLNQTLMFQLQTWSTLVLWGTVLLCVFDAYLLSRVIKRKMRERFGDDVQTRGHVSYGVLRAFQIRRWRLPKPQVARGQAPR
ncbi:DUF3043 domain-containing protein [Angustibacter speluncae]